MKSTNKWILLCLMMVTLLLLAAGCAFEQTPYVINDSDNFNVSVAFDANGGTFTTNTFVIKDSYNVGDMAVNGGGQVEIPLLAPNDPARGKDAFTPTQNGHFLVGWYAQRTAKTDADGNVTYTYSQPWDFATDRVSVDPNGSYTSAEPVLTLYAAWAPMYEIDFIAMDSGESVGKYQFDPNEVSEIQVPAWDEESGALNMFKFPKREGYTFTAAYYDAEGNNAVNEATITHPAVLHTEDATVENGTMTLYVDWAEGQWYRISTAEQFADNYDPAGCYEILADLDFTDVTWPTAMMYGTFTGTIHGNGHTVSNVALTQTNNSKVCAGLFGQLAAEAVLQDITFENVTFTIQSGTRVAGTSYGLFAGVVADRTVIENVFVLNSRLQIDSKCYFGTEDYSIGVLCGMGSVPVDPAGITCEAVGDAPETVNITVADNTVTVEFASGN